jgi:hypothetical protein
MTIEVRLEYVSLNCSNVRYGANDLMKFILELNLLIILRVLEKLQINETGETDLKSHHVRTEHHHGKTARW